MLRFLLEYGPDGGASTPRQILTTNAQDRPIVTRAEATAKGLKRYFTGVPCKNGHISWRSVPDKKCSGCNASRVAAWRRANPEKARASNKASQRSHAPQNRARRRQWYAARRNIRRAYTANWHKINPEKGRSYRAISAANRKKRFAEDPAFAAAEREKDRVKSANRRALQCQTGGRHFRADIADLLKRQKGKCAHPWCRKKLTDGYHVDHIIPLTKGGSNGRRNLQLLCRPCNMAKSNIHPVDFARRHGLLV